MSDAATYLLGGAGLGLIIGFMLGAMAKRGAK